MSTHYDPFEVGGVLLQEMEKAGFISSSRVKIFEAQMLAESIREDHALDLLFEDEIHSTENTPTRYVFTGTSSPITITWDAFKKVYTDYDTYPTAADVMQGLGVPLSHFKKGTTLGRTLARFREHFEATNPEARAMNMPFTNNRREAYAQVNKMKDDLPEADARNVHAGRKGKKTPSSSVLNMLNEKSIVPGELYNDVSRIPKKHWSFWAKMWNRKKTSLPEPKQIFGRHWSKTFILGFQFDKRLVIEIWYNSATSDFSVYDQNAVPLARPADSMSEAIRFFVSYLLRNSDEDEEVFKGNTNQLARSYMASIRGPAERDAIEAQRQADLAAKEAQKLNKKEQSKNFQPGQTVQDRQGQVDYEQEKRERQQAEAEKKQAAARVSNHKPWEDEDLEKLRGISKQAAANAAPTADQIRADQKNKAVEQEKERIQAQTQAQKDAEQILRQQRIEKQRAAAERIDIEEIENQREEARKKKERDEAARLAKNRRDSSIKKQKRADSQTAIDIKKKTGHFVTAADVNRAREALGNKKATAEALEQWLVREKKKAAAMKKRADAKKGPVGQAVDVARENEIEKKEKQLDRIKRELTALQQNVKNLEKKAGEQLELNLNENLQWEELRQRNPMVPQHDFFDPAAVREAANQNSKSRELLIYMPIKMFLDLAAVERIDEDKQRNVDELVASGTRFDSIPFLMIGRAENGVAKVRGHEGRHRARALAKIGITVMPAKLISDNIRWGSQDGRNKHDFIQDWPTVLVGESGGRYPFPIERDERLTEAFSNEERFNMEHGGNALINAERGINNDVRGVRRMAEVTTAMQVGDLDNVVADMITIYDESRVDRKSKRTWSEFRRGRDEKIEVPVQMGSSERYQLSSNYRADFVLGLSLRGEVNVEIWYITEDRGGPNPGNGRNLISSFYVYDVTAQKLLRANLPYYRNAMAVAFAKLGAT